MGHCAQYGASLPGVLRGWGVSGIVHQEGGSRVLDSWRCDPDRVVMGACDARRDEPASIHADRPKVRARVCPEADGQHADAIEGGALGLSGARGTG